MIPPPTFALNLGTGVPKGFKIARTAVMSVKAEKLLKRLPLKFKYETFGAITNFRNFFGLKFHRKWTGNDNKQAFC